MIAGKDSSRCRYHGNGKTRQQTLDRERGELNRHTTRMKMRGNVVRLFVVSFIFRHTREGKRKKKRKQTKVLAVWRCVYPGIN